MDMERKSNTHTFSKDYEDNTYSNLASKNRPYIDESKRTILKCLEDILDKRHNENVDSGKAVTIADFGTADGASSIPLLNKMIDVIKTKTPDAEIMVYFEDQPTNDFNLLYRSIFGLSNKQFGPLNLDEHVHVAAIGRNMYGPCLPPASVDIGFSSLALHWLSQLPCHIEKGFSYFDDTCTDEERMRFAARAREDWKSFVISRGRELKQGGYFICLIPSVDKEDEGSSVSKIYSEVLANMEKDGVITVVLAVQVTLNCLVSDCPIVTPLIRQLQEENVKITLCNYSSRTVDDFMEPFTTRDPGVTALGLQLISYCKKEFMRSEFATEKNVSTDDAYRAAFRNTIYHGLSEKRTNENKKKTCAKIFQQVSEILKTRMVLLPMHLMEVVIYRQCH